MPRPTPEHAETALRKRALPYPETHEDFPWGESALKVRGKVSCSCGAMKRVSAKLAQPASATPTASKLKRAK